MSEHALTDAEIRSLRSILTTLSSAEWHALKAIASGVVNATGGWNGPPSNGGSPSTPRDDELPDHFLDSQPWTDKQISRDPKRWAGQSMIGYRYSDAPSEWHDVMAEHYAYKAALGRAEPTARLQTQGKNKGKPWYEVDAFEAKICRAWSRRNRGKALPPEKPESRSTPADDGGAGADYVHVVSDGDDEIPF
jgi:hypothetical protein